ncbi:MAG TPA: hypothetical protein VEW92_14055, partial [Nitrososphaeraceae archaeon]|nr:hypothetical protein [Nitrososphaeraceae archaeon]
MPSNSSSSSSNSNSSGNISGSGGSGSGSSSGGSGTGGSNSAGPPGAGSNTSLKVLEAYTRDVGRGIARIDYDTMDSLTVSTGDVVEIRGKRRTTAKCL